MHATNPIVDLAGRTIVVVGAHTCVGTETARQLARCNASVVLATPTLEPAVRLIAEITNRRPHADLYFERWVDSDLDGVRAMAGRMRARYANLHGLVIVQPAMVDTAIASNCAESHRSAYTLAVSLSSAEGLARIVIASSLERAIGSTWQPRQVAAAADQLATANAMFAAALDPLVPGNVAVVCCGPTRALPEKRRSVAAKQEADAVYRALLDPRPQPARPWRIGRRWAWQRARPRLERRSRSWDPEDARRLGAWLQAETGIHGRLA